MSRKESLGKRVLRAVLTAVVTLTLLTAFFLAIIMGQPEKKEEGLNLAGQALPPPLAQSVSVNSASELALVKAAFPAPVMSAISTNMLTFQGANCQDVPFEDGVARVATILYYTPDGKSVTVQSICPARALAVMGKGDYVISGVAGHPLAGLRSIRMENAGSESGAIRMHAQSEQALYVVTLPNATSAVLRQLTSALQLSE